MNQQQRNQLYQQLIEEKKQVEQRLKQTDDYGLEIGMNDSLGELSGYDNHPADLGSEMYERGKDLALNDKDEHHLQDINRALKRMETGEYGLCKVCHQEIPFERLEAVPTTEYCLEHYPDKHPSARRPVEERSTSYDLYFLDNRNYNAYDAEDAWQEVEQYGTSNPPDYFAEGRNYNELTIDHNEQRGYIDLVEGFSIADIDGHTDDITEITHNQAYRQKDQEEALEETDTDFTGDWDTTV
ncbi:TraR/DksA C4-type zinc finger protein [Paenactinomyces guangxiensis]|uniref:TraR/DksA C4-type zinc finger protein n=1 Tax=Paenactinomyces guangxiensis TaxID=1490290 RepID=A0A7W2A830_9BACL|nr:TraR/DksA C4-type zinc finger protein [Paenactinomyces guangxiensis]MBA4494225.1 TraR/DksA C4-type zinc finger protein [Paenactinomyces guangxiensis]MBH8590721.1 TraR/DksA C4-type zinc finger protein [Paenactinomyces guangxiensis]